MNDWRAFPIFEIKKRLQRLLDQIEGLPDRMYVEIPKDIKAGEVALAFEFICDQADVYNVGLPATVKNEIRALGVLLNLPETAELIEDNPEI